MCHKCGDEYEEEEEYVEFNPAFINELQTLPPEMKEAFIDDLQETISYIMDRAEENGFLFEMITSWPRTKVAAYEAALCLEKNILDDGHNH